VARCQVELAFAHKQPRVGALPGCVATGFRGDFDLWLLCCVFAERGVHMLDLFSSLLNPASSISAHHAEEIVRMGTVSKAS